MFCYKIRLGNRFSYLNNLARFCYEALEIIFFTPFYSSMDS